MDRVRRWYVFGFDLLRDWELIFVPVENRISAIALNHNICSSVSMNQFNFTQRRKGAKVLRDFILICSNIYGWNPCRNPAISRAEAIRTESPDRNTEL